MAGHFLNAAGGRRFSNQTGFLIYSGVRITHQAILSHDELSQISLIFSNISPKFGQKSCLQD